MCKVDGKLYPAAASLQNCLRFSNNCQYLSILCDFGFTVILKVNGERILCKMYILYTPSRVQKILRLLFSHVNKQSFLKWMICKAILEKHKGFLYFNYVWMDFLCIFIALLCMFNREVIKSRCCCPQDTEAWQWVPRGTYMVVRWWIVCCY